MSAEIDVEIRIYPGYAGEFSKEQAKGAARNGSHVSGRLGAHMTGVVLGSIDARKINPEICERKGVRFGYWIEWAELPKQAYFVLDIHLKYQGAPRHDARNAEEVDAQ